MTLGGVLVLLFLLALGVLAVTTLVVAVRGGRGPADPPASRPYVDLGGFPVSPAPRGLLPDRSGRAAEQGAPQPARRPRAGFRLRSAAHVPMHQR